MTDLQKKIGRFAAYFTGGSLLVLLVGFVLLHLSIQKYLNENLSDFVKDKSKGKYDLSFERLKVNVITRGLEINGLSYHLTDSVAEPLEPIPTERFYAFSAASVRVNGVKLFKLLVQKKLEVSVLSVDQPRLTVHGAEQNVDPKESFASLLRELRPLVTQKFKSVRIDNIEFTRANFDFYSFLGDTRKFANAENVSVVIRDFYTDSLLLPNPERLFDAEDILVKMQNYQTRLADSVHQVTAGLITYSLKKNLIEGKDIRLSPVSATTSKTGKFFVSVPQLRIRSGHIKEFYRNNPIPIDSMILNKAEIKYWPGLKGKKLKDLTEGDFNLYELIKNDFPGIYVDNFLLKDTRLELFRSQSDTSSQQKLQNLTILLNDFRLDSVAQRDTSLLFYSGNIDLAANDYELLLGDNIHRITIGKMKLSTREKQIMVKNIRVFPEKTQADQSTRINTLEASCDSIQLDRFDFKKAYHTKRFNFQEINLFNPEVLLTQLEDSRNDTIRESSSFIYQLISVYAKGIYSKQIVVQRGKVKLLNKTGLLQTGEIESDIRLLLRRFSLDETTANQTDRLFFANQIDLNFSNYEMQLVDQLHKLTIGNFSLSTQNNKAQIENLHLYPVSKENVEEVLQKYKRSELYEFTVPRLSLNNADFKSAFFNKKFVADTLLISSPKIDYEIFGALKSKKDKADFEDLYGILSAYLQDIQIGAVIIPEGTIQLTNHSKKDKTVSLNNRFSLLLGKLHVNQDELGKEKLLFSEFVDFSVRDHLIHLSDNVHVLKAGEIGFSTRRKEIYALNAKMYPETNAKDFSSVSWNTQLTIPEIRLIGIDIPKFYFDKKIEAEKLVIKNPDIRLYQQKKGGNKDIKDLAVPIPKEIESLALQQFSLTNGSLKVFSELKANPTLIVQSGISMEARSIHAESSKMNGRPEFLSGDYSAKLIQFKFTPKDKNQQLSIDELTYSTKEKKILANDLRMRAVKPDLSKDQFELRIPNLELSGFDIDQAYKNNEYRFETILLTKPVFRLYKNSGDTVPFNPYNVNLYPHFESFADVFTTRSVVVKQADVSVFRRAKNVIREKFDFNLNNLRIDRSPASGFLHSGSFSFSIPEFQRETDLYRYTLGNTSYSSETGQFTVRNIRINPKYNAVRHQQRVGFQSDLISAKIDSISVMQPDVRRWFNKRELVGKKIIVYAPFADVFRDKRTPFNENQRPKMLQDLIKSVDYPASLDSLILKNGAAVYRERPVDGENSGEISFSGINVQMAPFSNIRKNGAIPDIKISAGGMLMDSCKLQLSMQFDMNSPENKFTAKGMLGEFNMPILNPVVEPLALLSIRSGRVNKFQFDFSGNKISSSGKLLFGYDNLKVTLLEVRNGNTREARFASFLANSLLLRSKNPRSKELLPDEISFSRDIKRSDLNYWWKSIFSGVRNTLGIEREAKPENNANP